MHWYWSLLALIVAVGIVSVIGGMTRYYFWQADDRLGGQFDAARAGAEQDLRHDQAGGRGVQSGKKSSFKTVVLVEYPREGIYSVGFITSERADEAEQKTGRKCVCIFIRRRRFRRADF